MAGEMEGDPALPIRLAVWKDTNVSQPAWGLIPIRITAAIHGNEELGAELALALLEKACRENPPELAGLELSPNKYWKTRSGAEHALLVQGHLKALLAMLAESRQGVHGRLLGDLDLGIETKVNAVKVADDISGARSISGPAPVPYTSFGLVSASDGSFHIPLGAGTYQLTVVRDGVGLAEGVACVEPGIGKYVEIEIVAP